MSMIETTETKCPVQALRFVIVGGTPIPATEAEWVVSNLPAGTAIEWGRGDKWGRGDEPIGCGTLLGSRRYDGVIARVRVGHVERSLHAYERGLWVREAVGGSVDGINCNGDGI